MGKLPLHKEMFQLYLMQTWKDWFTTDTAKLLLLISELFYGRVVSHREK